jgi:prepilin-type N-terminal cleavage/methylation domain-containing protein
LKARRSRRSGAGFTLIEIMLALVLLAFITSLLWGTFAQTAKVKKRVEASQDRTHTVRVALMRMSREIEMAYVAFESGGILEKRTMFSGTSRSDFDDLRFSWFGHQRMRSDVPEGDTSLVHYFTAPDPDDPG